jgi:D-sedoheptulose 7-phosphate isomerase
MSYIKNHFDEIQQIAKLIDTDKIEKLVIELKRIREIKGRVFFIGVGGSAANCSHAVNDFRKLCHLECYAPTDNIPELTARTNDEGWSTVFKEWLKISQLNSNDAIFIMSVGGGSKEKNVSPNIVEAIDLSLSLGSKVFSIVGKNDGYAYKKSDISIHIPVVNSGAITPHSEAFQAVV